LKISNISTQIILIVISLFSSYQCIAFQDRKLIDQEGGHKFGKNAVSIHWLGFHKYLEEQNIIEKQLQTQEIRIDKKSSIVMEIILEEKKVIYPSSSLHGLNFLATVFSGSLMPYYTKTNHNLIIRFRNESGVVYQSVQELTLHQWRGILLIPAMPFFWPSTIFQKNISQALEEGLKANE